MPTSTTIPATQRLSSRKVMTQGTAPYDQHTLLSIKQRLVREADDLRREVSQYDPRPVPFPLKLAIEQLDCCVLNLDLLLQE